MAVIVIMVKAVLKVILNKENKNPEKNTLKEEEIELQEAEGVDEIDIEELMLLSEVHTLNNPSAAFAIQTALFDLVSKVNKKTMVLFM